MNLRTALAAAIFAAASLAANAQQQQWLHIYTSPSEPKRDEMTNKVTDPNHSFFSRPWTEIDSIRYKPNSRGQYLAMRIFGDSKEETLALSRIERWEIGQNVPEFSFEIFDDPKLADVESKEEYLDCRMTIDGRGIYQDFTSDSIRIRGRGNSTWNFPKKAYRIKLPVKTKLCGFRKAKNYVLLANYIDVSFMRNAVACLATQHVGMPYPTHAIPVDVKFNGQYKGTYTLIEKVGVNNGSVNIPAADEANTCMFELDTSFDEELRAVSPLFSLPVMHKDPDVPEGVDPKQWFAEWIDDFNRMEEAVYYRNGVADQIDYTTLAKFLICYNLACNQELNHPKSLYLYKTRGEGAKYQFGPCWDFDWAFGYMPTYKTFSGEAISKEEGEKLIEAAMAEVNRLGLGEYGGSFYLNGQFLIYTGSGFLSFTEDNTVVEWPYGMKGYKPTYQNYLLGTGNNMQNSFGVGYGGEFLLSIIMDNPEFMEIYRTEWENFKTHLPELREQFDAYAKALAPSAERDATIWNGSYYSPAVDTEFRELRTWHSDAVEVLRTWLEKRIEFIDDPANNYGLYNPQTSFVPPFKKK